MADIEALAAGGGSTPASDYCPDDSPSPLEQPPPTVSVCSFWQEEPTNGLRPQDSEKVPLALPSPPVRVEPLDPPNVRSPRREPAPLRAAGPALEQVVVVPKLWSPRQEPAPLRAAGPEYEEVLDLPNVWSPRRETPPRRAAGPMDEEALVVPKLWSPRREPAPPRGAGPVQEEGLVVPRLWSPRSEPPPPRAAGPVQEEDVDLSKVWSPRHEPVSPRATSMPSEGCTDACTDVMSGVHVAPSRLSSNNSSFLGAPFVPSKVVRQRLLARLGQLNAECLVTGRDLHQAVSALGLERYSVRDMDYLVHRLATVVGLRFRPSENDSDRTLLRQFTALSLASTQSQRLARQAEWCWPEMTFTAMDKVASLERAPSSWRSSLSKAERQGALEDHNDKVVPLKVLVKAMTVDDVALKKLLGSSLSEQLFAIKEVLVTGDANRLVSELTCVRIDDLATRRPEPEWLIFEPLVGLIVVASGVMVGLQTRPELAGWEGWLWLDIAFAVLFSIEVLVRQVVEGFRTFWRGPGSLWNIFDVLLLFVGIGECGLAAAAQSSNLPSPAMLRVVRVLKLVRLVRIFRLRAMRELQLMVKALSGGLRTLFWAFVLLIFILYVLGVVTYSIFDGATENSIQELFGDVPSAMFTVFRCVIGDCFTRNGSSITSILVMQYGAVFAGSFFISYICINLGVFNVILAIYIETTMTAAKQAEGRQEKESIRVAHITKRLLKLFCAAEEVFNRQVSDGRRPSVDMKKLMTGIDINSTDVNENTSISKELFLIVLQEPEVQKLMDELDIPPDRASLFDSIDADASGTLHASELVMGLLKVRGEVKKSDQVACILALRAIQASLRQMEARVQSNQAMLEHLTGSGTSSKTLARPCC